MDKTKLLIIVSVGFVVSIAFAILGIVGYALYSDSQYSERVQQGFQKLSASDIEEATVLLWVCEGDDPVSLTAEHWPRLVQELQKLEHTNRIGMRGPWQIHRAIVFRAKNFGAVKIFLTKRPDTKMLANVYTTDQDAYFVGESLWSWLISLPEVKNQKPKETKPC